MLLKIYVYATLVDPVHFSPKCGKYANNSANETDCRTAVQYNTGHCIRITTKQGIYRQI